MEEGGVHLRTRRAQPVGESCHSVSTLASGARLTTLSPFFFPNAVLAVNIAEEEEAVEVSGHQMAASHGLRVPELVGVSRIT